jgi:subtilisin family serine protease
MGDRDVKRYSFGLAYSQIVARRRPDSPRWGASVMTITKSRARRTMTFAAIAAAAALAFSAAAPASAADGDGRWYFDALRVAEHHAAGWTGDGVTIAILDGPVNMDVPTLKNANIDVHEPSFCFDEEGSPEPAISSDLSGRNSAYHGTSVVSVIAGTGDGYPGQQGVQGIAPDAKVLYYAVATTVPDDAVGEKISSLEKDGQDLNDDEVSAAMNEAMDAGADIISISSGYNADALNGDAYARAIREGVIVIGSLRNNDDFALSLNFPGGANGAVGVQAADASATIQATDGVPNADTNTMVIAPGIDILTQGASSGNWEDQALNSGTSLAAPMVAGYLALAWQKYPAATGNQMLQSLIRNTGVDDHELQFDQAGQTGYGFVSATHMLRVDPTQYEDVNPLLDVRPVNIPSTAELLAPVKASPTPSNSAVAEPAAEASLAPGALVALLVGGFVVVAGIVLAVVLIVRRSRRAPASENRV